MTTRLIHQMWYDTEEYDNDLPPERYQYQEYIDDWKRHHPHWKYVFWNRRKIEELWEDHRLSKWRNFFYNLKVHIEKCDFTRYALLYLHGGLYTDLNFKCLKPIDNLLKGKEFAWAHESHKIGDNICIGNSFLYSKKNHWIWPLLMGHIMDNYETHSDSSGGKFNSTVLQNTGPLRLFLFSQQYRLEERHPEYYIDNCSIFYYNFENNEVQDRCVNTPDEDIYVYKMWKDTTKWWGNWDGLKMLNVYPYTKHLNQSHFHKYLDNKDPFNGYFVINRDNAEDRLKNTQRLLRKLDITPVRFRAVEGSEVSMEVKKHFKDLRDGEVGCFLSHLSLYSIISKHPDPNQYTIIFEDDIITSMSHPKDMEYAYSQIKKAKEYGSIDIVYLGKCCENCFQMEHIVENVYKAVNPNCLHAYAIRNGFARKLFHDIISNSDKPINDAIDKVILNHTDKMVTFHPSLFFQDILRYRSDSRDKPNMIYSYQECINGSSNNRSNISRGYMLLMVIVIISVVIVLYTTESIKY